MRVLGPAPWRRRLSRHREIRTLTRWYVMPCSSESTRRCRVIRGLLWLGPLAAVVGATALVVIAVLASGPAVTVVHAVLALVVLVGGWWRSSSSLTGGGCVLALGGIVLLSKELVLGWARVPLGALLFGCALVLAAVAIFQALREPSVASWADQEVDTTGLARRPNG